MDEVERVAQRDAFDESTAHENEAARQASYFDDGRHRYEVDAILHPPYHVRLEIEQVVGPVLAMGLQPTDTVIDFGAGSGRISIPLLQQGQRVLAIDVSEGSLQGLRHLAQSLNLDGLTTSTDLPSDGGYRAIVGADILHHVDMNLYLPRLYDVLVPGGEIIFSEPGALNPTWYVYLPLFYDWSVERGVTTCTLWNLTAQLRRHGFREISITGLGLLPRSLLSWTQQGARLNDRIGDLPGIRLCAYRYIVRAKK